MIYAIPDLEPIDRQVIDLINDQRLMLRHDVNQNPVRWTGFLRRNTLARAIQGSNSIEGINANLAEAVAIVDDERPQTLDEETRKALSCYRNAMTYVIRSHEDPHLEISPQFIRSLHFMMLNYDMTKLPGQWRNGQIFVVREETDERVYEGPDAELVPGLMAELVEQIHASAGADVDPTVRGAMAHLNLTMIHPFKDGNGRMARAIQTLVMARDGILSPVFCSIEEWLGRNTQAYYDKLAEVGQGQWNPGHNALPWVRFCLVAHYQQAATLIRRNQEVGRIWEAVDRLRREFSIPDRSQLTLMDAAYGYRVTNVSYRADQEPPISDVVASRDLRRLCDVGLLEAVGEKRGRFYKAAQRLVDLRASLRSPRRVANPYDLVADETTRGGLSALLAGRGVV